MPRVNLGRKPENDALVKLIWGCGGCVPGESGGDGRILHTDAAEAEEGPQQIHRGGAAEAGTGAAHPH